jgi:hypothetical protein
MMAAGAVIQSEISTDELVLAAGSGTLHAIIDHVGDEQLHTVLACIPPERAVPLFSPEEPGDGDFAPRVVLMNRELLQIVLTNFSPKPWGVFARSTVSSAQIVRHLKRFNLVRLPEDDAPMLFRFYDPRVLVPFLGHSSPTELREFFGPVECWYVPVDGRIFRFDLPENAPGPGQTPRRSIGEAYVLSAGQISAFGNAYDRVLVTQLAEFVSDEYPDLTAMLAADELEDMIRSGLATARSYRLPEPEEAARFIALQFEICPLFHTHPAIHAVLTATGIAPKQKIRHALRWLPESVWEEARFMIDEES